MAKGRAFIPILEHQAVQAQLLDAQARLREAVRLMEGSVNWQRRKDGQPVAPGCPCTGPAELQEFIARVTGQPLPVDSIHAPSTARVQPAPEQIPLNQCPKCHGKGRYFVDGREYDGRCICRASYCDHPTNGFHCHVCDGKGTI